jgi:serine/threonine protein kinase
VDSSGGTFGVGYKATKGNHIAFIKAIDFVDAFNADEPMLELAKLTSIAMFEKDVLEYCSSKGMSKVIRYIGHEYLYFNGSKDPLNQVSCLIMESGDHDLRRLVSVNGLASCSWNLQVMCDVSQALTQLHKGGIAHHDIKPSNVISIKEEEKKSQSMKVSDLGRVIRKDQSGPFDSNHWSGDSKYCPPERWYGSSPGAIPHGWNNIRESADAYMLGSLLVYLFTGTTLQSLVYSIIPSQFRPGNWTGGYDENLLPVLFDAHVQALKLNLLPNLIPEVADEVFEIAKNITHPDPRKRGDTKARKELNQPVGIDRIHQKFTRLSLTCSAVERGRKK